jgi:hypothetical protein
MSGTLKVRVDFDAKSLTKAFGEARTPIALAATAAMHDAAEYMKKLGRRRIEAAGLGSGMTNALTVNVYPLDGKPTLSPAAYLYHKIPYAWVFEQGAAIRGKPMLWLALDAVPKRRGRHKRPRELGIKLKSVKRPGKAPLLVGKLRRSKEVVPLYVGIDMVNIRKRFDLSDVSEKVSKAIPAFYYRYFKG